MAQWFGLTPQTVCCSQWARNGLSEADPVPDMRGDIDTDTLLKVVLVLAVVWLALEILDLFIDTLQFVFNFLPKVLGVALIVIIILYLLDRL